MSLAYRAFINRELPIVERACTSKTSYVSQSEARNLLRHGRHAGSGMEPYHCQFCGFWHVGHRRRR